MSRGKRTAISVDGWYVQRDAQGWRWVRRVGEATVFPTRMDAHTFAARHLSRHERAVMHLATPRVRAQ